MACVLEFLLMSPAPLFAYDKQVCDWRLSKDVLGSGTTSTVVRATHVKLPTLYAAVKIISRSTLLVNAKANPTALHLADSVIHREVVLMKLAHHERIVRLYDIFRSGDLIYIIMEHARHKTLFDLFRIWPSYLPLSLVIHIFSQFIQGLAYAHGLHIVHRDLKLENIFLFGPDFKSLLHADSSVYTKLNVKIGDFGLAHVNDPGTLSTVFHGSPHYQAPEIWLRVPHLPHPTDVWSAGVVLYALICRKLPFDVTALKNVTLPFDVTGETASDDRVIDPVGFTPTQTGNQYMLYEAPENLHPAADSLLRKIFAYNPIIRPTARDMLWDIFFEGLAEPREPRGAYNDRSLVLHPRMDLYDLATLCVSPRCHIPRDTFVHSALARVLKDRLADPTGGFIERQWMQRLSAYEAGKDAWEASLEAQVAEMHVSHMRSLGWKGRVETTASARGELNLVPASRPKLVGSLSFRSFRARNAPKAHRGGAAPHGSASALHSTVTPPYAQPSAVAGALEDRREALLRRAYELGFGTGDLRAFADEATMIVRVAREGGWGTGLQDIAREMERRHRAATCDVDLGYHKPEGATLEPLSGSVCASAATTLVSAKVASQRGRSRVVTAGVACG